MKGLNLKRTEEKKIKEQRRRGQFQILKFTINKCAHIHTHMYTYKHTYTEFIQIKSEAAEYLRFRCQRHQSILQILFN